jgi:type III pantothenate kinase
MKQCIAVDVGNTSTTLAICRDGKAFRVARLQAAEQMPRTVDAALRSLVRTEQMDGAIVSSVVPDKTDMWRTAVRKVTLCHPIELTSRCRLNIRLDYPRPATLGADRIANACAAYGKFRGPIIVADIGTAATVDLVTGDGRFLGGAITPGPMMMLRALAQQTAMLPQIEWAPQAPEIGRSTEAAMQMGVQAGYGAMILAIVSRLSKKAGRAQPKLCATGGYARMALEGAKTGFAIDEHLTIEGLARIWDLNA